jgi:hypothetical protein
MSLFMEPKSLIYRFPKGSESQIHQLKMLAAKWYPDNGNAEQDTKEQMG